jgi:hypothetical protein
MKYIFLLLALISISADAEERSYTWKNFDQVLKTLPKDAEKSLDNIVTCRHLPGEIDGDLEHDKETILLIEKLECDKAEERFNHIKTKQYKPFFVRMSAKIIFKK